jgi:hypothetical protein
MINPTGKKLQKIISKMIDEEIEGVDKYTLNGSTWLIFTDQKRWVVEYTEDNILWYNYSFFTEIFEILNMKVTDNQNLVQEWFESRFLNINPVENTIQNGVKHTKRKWSSYPKRVENTIQNGVKHTIKPSYFNSLGVENTIQNGVKHTRMNTWTWSSEAESITQNGKIGVVGTGFATTNEINDIIENNKIR